MIFSTTYSGDGNVRYGSFADIKERIRDVSLVNWVTHLCPIYVPTIICVVGAILAPRAMTTTGRA